MKLNTKVLKNTLETLSVPLLVIFAVTMNTILYPGPGEGGIALFFLCAYLLVFLGFIFGILKRKYALFGLSPFALWFLTTQFLFPGSETFEPPTGLRYLEMIMEMAGYLAILYYPGWIVGWALRIGSEWVYQHWKRIRDKIKGRSESL